MEKIDRPALVPIMRCQKRLAYPAAQVVTSSASVVLASDAEDSTHTEKTCPHVAAGFPLCAIRPEHIAGRHSRAKKSVSKQSN